MPRDSTPPECFRLTLTFTRPLTKEKITWITEQQFAAKGATVERVPRGEHYDDNDSTRGDAGDGRTVEFRLRAPVTREVNEVWRRWVREGDAEDGEGVERGEGVGLDTYRFVGED